MRDFCKPVRIAFAGGALACALALGAPGTAFALDQPTKQAVQEIELLRKVKPVTGLVSIPDEKSRVLIQPEGKAFRDAQRDILPWIAAVAILGMVAALALFYFIRGKIRVKSGLSGHLMPRFPAAERINHWMTATAFILLGLTGLVTAFGRELLLPWMGESAFSELARVGKFIHDYFGFAFIVGVIMMAVFWLKDNLFSRIDWNWIRKGGGIIGSGGEPPAGRFNAGEKILFWLVILGGLVMGVTGVALLFPFAFADIQGMQIITLIHAICAVLLIGMILAHIYIGTIGMEGALPSMTTGMVDVNWAKEHHSLWYARQRAAMPEPLDVKVVDVRIVPAE